MSGFGQDRDHIPEAGDVELSPRTPGLIHLTPDSETTPAAPGGRRRARAAALQALYESELTGHPGAEALRHIAAREHLREDLAGFAADLVRAVEKRRRDLDARIAELAPGRPVEQIDAIDRAILRLALAELDGEDGSSTPPAVVANEAVELAHLYGSDSSPRFVNGVLGAVLR